METQSSPGNFDKTMGIVAYLSLVGWVIALVQNNDKKGYEKTFTAFHLRQMLGIMIIGFCIWIIQIPLALIPFIGFATSVVLSLGVFAFWILGIVGAANGQRKELPYIGEPIQKMLGKLFE
ncbi:MAG: hypothetical protein A3D31_00760 [Candidatus Fluviicola riflensis]|nr:MAG: hypothetical protein CHH17_04785 [Candidatus Fluviicola riflensis]OGS76139.1 MAG: hypothetical protein A3D31_00760 [Candidatus Fluviicola riflensis]OGS83317.1 MAG: hypothetical protein A2724_01080 [Fluviicola sp. RIFCSPHIGHO2_01_FULL_43_53]OGS83671.1 MAG: hypothetical protein A3E30_17365 [Fluviicola sp. RIFCSPHIGHO2_12_FULL_43_24]